MHRILLVIAALTLAACETIEGAGKDLSAAGRTISQEAREVKSSL